VASLTDKTIARAIREAKGSATDIYLTDEAKARGIGRLRARARSTSQCLFYFRYVDPTGKQDSIAIGVYDVEGRQGLTLRKAREKAGELSRLYQDGRRDLRAYVEHIEAGARAERESAARARAEAEQHATAGTLRALLDGYVEHLKRQKKSSAGDAANLFKLNVYEAWPHLAALPARDITSKDVSTMLARLIDAGKGRSAAKLRSYLRAAFAAALDAGNDPTVHPALHKFHLPSNPAAAVSAKRLSQFNNARVRTLNTFELMGFMQALDSLPDGLNRGVLWLCLLLGGQRPIQLLRLRPSDVDMDEGTITIYDIKGARSQPRAHRLPMTNKAAKIVGRWLNKSLEVDEDDEDATVSDYVFSNTRKVPLRVETISEVVKEISKAMVKKKAARSAFQLRDIRRTCETMMAALGVSKDIRAQLQSHGLGGVQDRHYDRHEYMEEKRIALEKWGARLMEIASGSDLNKVVSLTRKGKSTRGR